MFWLQYHSSQRNKIEGETMYKQILASKPVKSFSPKHVEGFGSLTEFKRDSSTNTLIWRYGKSKERLHER
jgi:hypothetical protein